MTNEHFQSVEAQPELILEKMKESEVLEFLKRYRIHVLQGAFRERTIEELKLLISNNWLLKKEGDPVGSVALIEHDNWLEISTLSVDIPGFGYGKKLLQEVRKMMKGKYLYALSSSPEALSLFESCDFLHMGTLQGVQQSEIGEFFPTTLQKYDTTVRNPYVVVCWDNQQGI